MDANRCGTTNAGTIFELRATRISRVNTQNALAAHCAALLGGSTNSCYFIVIASFVVDLSALCDSTAEAASPNSNFEARLIGYGTI